MAKNNQPIENPQWENFARLYFEGKSAEQAYTLAGFKSKYPRKNAPRLLKKQVIIDRIRHFKTQAAIKAGITQETQAKKLEDVIIRSQEKGDRTNEIAAIREENKLYGLITEKIQTETTKPTELTAEQKREAALFAEWKLNHANQRTYNNLPEQEAKREDRSEAAAERVFQEGTEQDYSPSFGRELPAEEAPAFMGNRCTDRAKNERGGGQKADDPQGGGA